MPSDTENSRPFNPDAPWLGGYRRGFEPRPGETDAERLKRETAELERRVRNRKKYGATYDQYKNAAGGKIKSKPKKMAKGGSVSASRRADGIARKGKTRGKVC